MKKAMSKIFSSSFFQKGIFVQTAFFIWFLVVYCSYFYFHGGRRDALFLFIVAGVGCAVFYAFLKQKFFRPVLSFTVASLQIFLAFFAGIIIIGFIVYVHSLGFKNWPFDLILKNFLTVVFPHIFLKVLFLLTFFIVISAFGRKIFRIISCSWNTPAEELLYSFAAGFLAYNILAYIFAVFGGLTLLPLIFLWGGMTFWIRREIFLIIKILLYPRVHIFFDFSVQPQNFFSVLYFGVFIFFLFGFLETLLVYPVEIDTLSIYYFVPESYTRSGGIVPFYDSLGTLGGIVMFFYASVNALFGAVFSFSIPFLFFLLLAAALYYFSKKFFTPEISAVTLLTSLSMPMNAYFLFTTKIDFILAFYSVLTVLALFLYRETGKSFHLYFGAVMLGYIINIKFTGLIFALAVFGFLLVMARQYQIRLKKFAVFFLFFFLFSLPMPFLHWYYYQNPFSPVPLGRWFDSPEPLFRGGELTHVYQVWSTPFARERIWEYTRITRQNAVSQNPMINFFWKMWNITMNQRGFSFIYSEIGPYLLAALPFFLLYFFSQRLRRKRNFLELVLLSSIFLVLWNFLGNERIWFAAPMLYLLFILSAFVFLEMRQRFIRIALWVCITVFFIRTLADMLWITVSTPNITSSPENLSYGSALTVPQRFELYNFINTEIIEKKKSGRILFIGETRLSFLQEADRNVVADQYNIFWGKMIQESQDFDSLLNLLKQQNITHIMYSLRDESHLKNYVLGSSQKFQSIEDFDLFHRFKKKYLREMKCIREMCLYEVI